MTPLATLFTLAALGFILLLVLWGGRARSRRRLLQRPAPAHWPPLLEATLPIYRRLPPDLRRRLHGLMHLFLHDKHFEGCGGLVVTEEMRLLVAAQACLLLLGRGGPCYPGLGSILLYPAAFRPQQGLFFRDDGERDDDVRLGESWAHGTIVLSWEDTDRGGRHDQDGTNVVIHEFAHQLDTADGDADGHLPLNRDNARRWDRVFRRELHQLRRRLRLRRPHLLDAYGAEDPAEFFAVSCETFFERPQQLQRRHPELYAELRRFFALDPAAWEEPQAAGASDEDQKRNINPT